MTAEFKRHLVKDRPISQVCWKHRLITHLATCLIFMSEKLWWKRSRNLLCTSGNFLTIVSLVIVCKQVCKTCFREVWFRFFLSVHEYSSRRRWLPRKFLSSCYVVDATKSTNGQGLCAAFPPVPLARGNQHASPWKEALSYYIHLWLYPVTAVLSGKYPCLLSFNTH